jgi:HlyD family secretion protein
MKTKRMTHLLGWMMMAVLVTGCSSSSTATRGGSLQASGTISVDTVQIGAEIAGKILEISVEKGDAVNAGDIVFRLDDQVLQAQYDQANATVHVAQANLDIAQQRLTSAQLQLALAEQTADLQDAQSHLSAWRNAQSGKIELPSWYFSKEEKITALRSQVTAAQQDLDEQNANLQTVLKNASNQDFVAAEHRLAEAQQAYMIANQTLNEAKGAVDTDKLQDSAQDKFDAATTELDAAQADYDAMLSTDAADHVLEARAQVAVAEETLRNSRDALNKLLTGDESLQVNAALSGVDQAGSAVTQAQAALEQAQAALHVITIQLEKAVVRSPVDGVILARPMNAGELVNTGTTVVEIGSLEHVTLDVYIPESEYGQVQLGQTANVSTDSFPGMTFAGQVTYISNQAEFTPRNVQTVESRSTTVYKIEIIIPNPDLKLKPGMPADAIIIISE